MKDIGGAKRLDRGIADWAGIQCLKMRQTRVSMISMATGEELRQTGRAEQAIWRVMRLDDNGNHFEVAHGLTRAAAREMVKHFEESGHKQFYWILSGSNGG